MWNEAGTFLDFSIAPAYWHTNWFRALCMLAFVAMLWTDYRLRVRVLEERQAILERHQAEIGALNERLMKAQEEERIRIAGELHDGVLQKITSLSLELATATLELTKRSKIHRFSPRINEVAVLSFGSNYFPSSSLGLAVREL